MSFWTGIKAVSKLTGLAEKLDELQDSDAWFAEPLRSARGVVDRGVMRESQLESVAPEELHLPLLAAKLSFAAYEFTTGDALAHELNSLMPGAQLLHLQPQVGLCACWFLVRGIVSGNSQSSLLLVFRGTLTAPDVVNDICVASEDGPHGGRFHSGFLRTVRDDANLHRELAKHLPPTSTEPLYLLGHSLGGALAMTLLYAKLLPAQRPPGCARQVTVVALGSPMVSYGAPDPQNARIILVINDRDSVPRLLGSKTPLLQRVLSATTVAPQVLRELEYYKHAEATEILYLHHGKAERVPQQAEVRDAVLHVGDAAIAASWTVQDHLQYPEAIAKAMCR